MVPRHLSELPLLRGPLLPPPGLSSALHTEVHRIGTELQRSQNEIAADPGGHRAARERLVNLQSRLEDLTETDSMNSVEYRSASNDVGYQFNQLPQVGPRADAATMLQARVLIGTGGRSAEEAAERFGIANPDDRAELQDLHAQMQRFGGTLEESVAGVADPAEEDDDREFRRARARAMGS